MQKTQHTWLHCGCTKSIQINNTKEEILRDNYQKVFTAQKYDSKVNKKMDELWVLPAMDEYAKEQAIAFDRWKVEEGWEWSTSKWAERRKVFWHQCPVTEYLTEDQLWDKFIEHQKQQQ